MSTRIEIVSKDHPHFGERGDIKLTESGKVLLKPLFGKDMFEMVLDSCPHGIESCYVGREDVSLIP